MRIETEIWRRAQPLRITGYTHVQVEVLVVTLERNGKAGRGEGAGIYYRGETPASMVAQLEAVRGTIEAGIDRLDLPKILPAGGARNALDCAMWDLEAQLCGLPVWQLAGLPPPRPLLTTFTCGAQTPAQMAETAKSFEGARAIKLKLTGEDVDADRLLAVRSALPEAWILVDANQGFTVQSFLAILPTLSECGVSVIEQPFPLDHDEWMDEIECPIPILADESLQVIEDVPKLVGRFDGANIKLDKCGGLTEGLAIARALRGSQLDVMVGSMGGTSLAMGPIFLVGQLATYADLDGPALLSCDRPDGVRYIDGKIAGSTSLWGSGA